MTDQFGGTPLPPVTTTSPPLTVWYDPSLTEEKAQQPHAQQVAAFEAVPNHLNQAVLDVNQHFLVYAVKNGLLRVLHRSSSVRSLLRGHSEKVQNVLFFQNGDVLGTVGGNVLIWRIFYNSPDINAEKLLEIPMLPNCEYKRLIWHPFNPNQFWLMYQNAFGVTEATLVETTRITTVQHEAEGHALCQLYNDVSVMDGAVLISSGSNAMNDLSWSGKDTRHVLTCHDDGTIRLWNVKKLGDNDNGMLPAECVVTITDGNDPVTRCMFLPHDNIATEQNEDGLTSAFLTASNDNSVITLWSAFYADRKPTKLQMFGMQQVSSPSTAYNVNLAYGPASPSKSPPTFFVLLSDRTSGKVYTLHLQSVWSNAPPKRALMVGMDYIVPFSIKFPIYSWSIACVPAESVGDDEDLGESGVNFDVRFFAYQSKMVQQYTLPHYMCLPPLQPWTRDTPGVRVESDVLDAAAATAIDTAVEAMNNYMEDYELDEDEGNVEEEEEEDDDDDFEPPAASALPVPDGLAAPATDAPAAANSNPFANWLGAIAAKTTATGTPGNVPPPPTPVTSTSTSSVDMSKAAPMPSMEPSAFLNPAELLKSSGSMSDIDQAMEALPTQPPQPPAEPKQKKKSPASSKSNGGKKTKTPPRSTQPKIAILKRGEESPAAMQAVSPPASSGTTGAASQYDLEDVLNKSLAAHFKRQENFIAEQVQKAVKSEMQTTVVPTLSKMMTQTMEQAVVKPVKAALDKNAKERTKVQTDVIVNAVSTSVEEPLKSAFQSAMATALVPAYELATREMFLQVSSSLEKGLAGGSQSSTDAAAVQALSSKLDAMSRTMEVLKSEVTQLRTAVASSKGVSPQGLGIVEIGVPQPDPSQVARDEIIELLKAKEYEPAFTRALSASAADMAVFCCKNANVADVLGGNSPALSQPILLCLMQQLGAVLVSSSDDDLQTILLWLQEIALTLDPTNEGVQRHVPGVLQQLVASIDTKMAEGDPTLRRPLQMLLQVIRGMQR